MIQTPEVSGEGSKEARNHSLQGPLNFGVIRVYPLPYSFADSAGAIIAETGHTFGFLVGTVFTWTALDRTHFTAFCCWFGIWIQQFSGLAGVVLRDDVWCPSFTDPGSSQ